jgi:hypothetical protein
VAPAHTPLGNIWTSVANIFGCPELQFGESTGVLNDLV